VCIRIDEEIARVSTDNQLVNDNENPNVEAGLHQSGNTVTEERHFPTRPALDLALVEAEIHSFVQNELEMSEASILRRSSRYVRECGDLP